MPLLYSEKIGRILAAEHISTAELALMVKHAAISSQYGFTRRYYHWLFKFSGTTLVDMRHQHMVEVGAGTTFVREEHEACHGTGCKDCRWVGEIKRWIRDSHGEQPMSA